MLMSILDGVRRVSFTHAKRHFERLVDEVAETGEPIVVTYRRKDHLVILPLATMADMVRQQALLSVEIVADE